MLPVKYIKSGTNYGNKTLQHHIYSINGFNDVKNYDVSNCKINVTANEVVNTDDVNICLNIMMLPREIIDLENNKDGKLTDFIESLQSFDYVFKNVFIVIDSTNKYENAEIMSIDFFIASLKHNKIITQDAKIKCDFLEYKTKQNEYKDILKTIFSYNNVDDICIERTYKNAFAYYYSLFNSPCQYLFHMDLLRNNGVCYIKGETSSIENNYILKSVELLQRYKDVIFVGIIGDSNIFTYNSIVPSHFSIYFDNKENISLQCFVNDTTKWRNLFPYNKCFYRYQTENAISSELNEKNATSISLLPNEINILKIKYK
jgi:hypothetical protein